MSATVVLVGRVGRDPEMRQAGQYAVTEVSIATDSGWGDRKATTWWRVSIWGKSGEAAARAMSRGSQVAISGEPVLREYTKKDGSHGASLEVRCDRWEFVGPRPEQAGRPRAQAQRQVPPPGDDDIPF